ncbi:hypothetical protein ZWY2020_029002 [Hordeum vulgare]|nr:hypothetical protein ZWY2020_029002 [Hordeum vulgare]
MLLAILLILLQTGTTDLQILLTTEFSEWRQILLWIAFSPLCRQSAYGTNFQYPCFRATLCFTPFIYTLSAIAIIYTSLTTLRQIDLKKIIAYSSVAHMNLVTIGMFSRTAAVRSPILSYGHTSKAKTCVPGVRPINLLAIGEKT